MKTWQKIKQNPSLISQYLVREKVVDVVRDFFKSRGFHEAFTPTMVPIPSIESNLEVFETELRTSRGKKSRAFLIMSPEYALKKLIASGIGNVFEITRSFRNEEEISSQHNPEFSILEWYQVNADYNNIMQDFSELFVAVIKKINPDVDLKHWKYQGEEYDISLPWEKVSVSEVFEKFCGIGVDQLLDEQELIGICRNRGYAMTDETTWEQAFYQLIFNEIEPEFRKMHRPVFFYDYPKSQASLSKLKASDPRFAERFEVFLAGLELGNCFSELTDWREQKERFEKDKEERQKMGKTEYGIDEDLLEALKGIDFEVSGIAVGLDRIIMLAADVPSISETLFFPANELFDL